MLIKLGTWSCVENKMRDEVIMRNDNKSFGRVEDFKCSVTKLTDQNSIPQKVKTRSNYVKVCYYSVQNILSSS
jgi:hypothetical protein